MYQYKLVSYIISALHTFLYIMYFYVDYVTDSVSVKIHERWITMNEWMKN